MKKYGYVCSTDEHGSVEHNAFTCGHCNRIVVVPSNKLHVDQAGGWCSNCAGMICPNCVGQRACFPFEKKIEAQEARARNIRQSYG